MKVQLATVLALLVALAGAIVYAEREYAHAAEVQRSFAQTSLDITRSRYEAQLDGYQVRLEATSDPGRQRTLNELIRRTEAQLYRLDELELEILK